MMMLPQLLLLLLCAVEARADPTLVTTPSGVVQGARAPNNTLIWRGIPYAEPPTGPLRWRSPKPAAPWNGTLQAREFKPNCAQLGPAWVSLHGAVQDCHNYMKGCVNWTWSNATSEDCLYINVHQSATPAPKPRPVVVYFAAGAFEWGAANDAENSGDNLGAKPGWEDVILVTLNCERRRPLSPRTGSPAARRVPEQNLAAAAISRRSQRHLWIPSERRAARARRTQHVRRLRSAGPDARAGMGERPHR
jgi:hypothetical protein